MKKLLSLPPNLVDCFNEVTGLDKNEYFCSCDPIGHRLGSGGGTAWLIRQCYEQEKTDAPFSEWLSSDRRLILHAGGQSRRLPAYAPSGKILTPIPVFRWERGQRLDQNLLSIQLPLYEKIMAAAPRSLNTMIVSGDVYIRSTRPLQNIPDADVVCYGLWLGAEIAKDHGVFISKRNSPSVLKCMMQKPSEAQLSDLLNAHFYLTDIGVWLLSDKAVKVLMKRSEEGGKLKNYDLYSEFGCALGTEPTIKDDEINALKVAILPLPGGEFYHYGSSHEILSSTLAVQNLVNDQREIIHHDHKPHPAIFVQNAVTKIPFTADNYNIWVENSHIGAQWALSHDHIITGVPVNDWSVTLQPKQCVDIVPISEKEYAVRPYGYDDKFAGDQQFAPLFPLCSDIPEMGMLLRYMLSGGEYEEGRQLWEKAKKISADEISNTANMHRLEAQRCGYRASDWSAIAVNYRHSVFYQVDLDHAAHDFSEMHIPLPPSIEETAPLMTRIHDAMFRSEVNRLNGCDDEQQGKKAFGLLREGLTSTVLAEKQSPKMSVYGDQIVWGRSPVRIDIAGGWTDTPPFCLMEGGNVINLAIELNGQPPLQTYIRPCREKHIVLRSIDLGASEEITTFEQLADFNHVGSPFSIPKAALVLAGFQPGFSESRYTSLEQQLDDFGCGFEITLLSAIPAGSGLGTSSVLASTVLGAVNDFCGLGWDKNEICKRTLVLEQLLTTGGGWQDQFGGVLQGVKLLQTTKGFDQTPVVKWLPNDLFVQPEYKSCHLLYYTGITRTAKKILSEIVRRMFLNSSEQIQLLREMKQHTLDMYEAIQRNNFRETGLLMRKTWIQNQALDQGTNPAEVKRLTDLIDDYCLGYKLPGAGGGGYLYMIAKDPEAAACIKQILHDNRPNENARFVDMDLSTKGLQVSRS